MWLDVPYDPANFSAGGPMGWTVQPGDVRAFWYELRDGMMTVGFYLIQTQVWGTAGTQLKLKIPAGKVPARYGVNTMKTWTDEDHRHFKQDMPIGNGAQANEAWIDGGEQIEAGVIEAEPGSPWLNLHSRGYIDGGKPWSVDNDCQTWLCGQITFPIQQ